MDNRLDKVLSYLIAVNLTEFEDKYRGYLYVSGANGDAPEVRHFCIATLAVMLELAGVPPQASQYVISELKSQSDAELKEGIVAILNGSHLIVSKGEESNKMVLLPTLQPTEDQPPYTLTSTMYFVKNLWKQASDILAGKA